MNIEQLLYEEESTSLDFKRESYKFTNANDYQKSELLKDILAFANAWRRNTAYILLGVEEVKGGRSIPVGITDELDDAQLQEFINKKTQKPITFTYRTQTINDVKVGVIEIPNQGRPFFLVKKFDRLNKNIVYIRRGSSTDEATPDEVMQMAQAQMESSVEVPELLIELADINNETVIGNEQTITPVLLDISRYEEIGDFGDPEPDFSGLGIMQYQTAQNLFRETPRRNYYRELAAYQFVHAQTKELSFSITNPSQVSVTDVSVIISIEKKPDKFCIVEPNELPEVPKSHDVSILLTPPLPSFNFANNLINQEKTFSLEKLDESYRVKLTFHKIQPKQTIFCDEFICLKALDNFVFHANVTVYADNLPDPIKSTLTIKCNTEEKTRLFDGIE